MENVWQAYQAEKTPELKEKLILKYAHLVKFVAGRIQIHIGSRVEYDDLVSYGVFGLIDAIDKFDMEKGVKFETYASLRIRGSIIDHIRRLDPVPRTLRQKNKQLLDAQGQLEELLGREPTDAELAEKLGMTLSEVRDFIRKATVLSVVSLDDFLEQNHETVFEGLSTGKQETPESGIERQELQQMLADAISRLAEKEKLVVTLYYYEDLTLKEISSIMKVSESRISQIHTKALGKLNGKLGRFKSILFNS